MKTNEIKNKNKAEEKLKSWEKRKRNYYFHLALIFKMEIFKVEKDENKDPNITDGKAAFDLLSGLVSNHKKRLRELDEETSTNHLPGCLSDLLSCEKSVRKFSCMLCGRLFHDSHQLVVHSHSHTAKDNSQNECCFCGRGFEDYLKLTLHQIAMPVRHKCQNCFQGFENYNKYTHHSCRKVIYLVCIF